MNVVDVSEDKMAALLRAAAVLVYDIEASYTPWECVHPEVDGLQDAVEAVFGEAVFHEALAEARRDPYGVA